MDKKLLLKLVAIGFMSLLLLVPLALIEDQIRQRSSRQEEVQRSIANSAAGPQTLTGPVLAIHYREQIEPEIKEDPATGRTRSTPRFVERSLYLPAETLKLSGEARVETRQRGIYQARLYHLDLAVAGRFVLPAHLGLDAAAQHRQRRSDAAAGRFRPARRRQRSASEPGRQELSLLDAQESSAGR